MRIKKTSTPDFTYGELMQLCAKGEDFDAFVSFLHQHGGLNATDENGRSALMFCITNLKNPITSYPFAIDFAKRLIDLGVDVNQTDFNGWTVVHFCLQDGHNDLLDILLAHPKLHLRPNILGFALLYQPTNLLLLGRLMALGANPYARAVKGQSFYEAMLEVVGQDLVIGGQAVPVQSILELIHEVCGEKPSASPLDMEE